VAGLNKSSHLVSDRIHCEKAAIDITGYLFRQKHENPVPWLYPGYLPRHGTQA